jgi:uncharacterized membrane protein YoaK (UPF0700 family)
VARPPAASRPRVAVALAAIGGFVDAVGFLTLFGLFTAHLSGNTARLGIDLGQDELSAALTYAVPIVGFFGAVLAGGLFCSVGDARRWNTLRSLLAIETALLASFMVVGTAVRDHGDLTPRSGAYYLLAVVAVTAMGLQTASLRQVAGVPVHTTFITGMVVSFAEEVAGALRHEDADASRRARIHGVLIGTYLAGAVSGSALFGEWRVWALAVPVVVLAALTAAAGTPVAVEPG